MASADKKVLLVCDMTGYGNIALSALIPIFSRMGCEPFNLPTALVSNTFDYGKFEILDTTAYMRGTLKVWDSLKFYFDAVCTGFMATREQSEIIYDYCRREKTGRGLKLIVDPVMGDGGRLYNGVTQENVLCMKKMCSLADLIIPNATEACFLCDFTPKRDANGKLLFSREDIDLLTSELRKLGAKNIVISSANIDGAACTIICEEDTTQWLSLPYREIPVAFHGTGDIFTALIASQMLGGTKLEPAVGGAIRIVEELMDSNRDLSDKYKGIPISRLEPLLPER